MWHNRLSEYLLNDGYVNNQVCPYIFIKRSSPGFVIIVVYVDDLKNEFEIKDLGKTRLALIFRNIFSSIKLH